MQDYFDFCPKYMVPKTKPPTTDVKGVSMNGWFFSSKPRVPYQKSFSVTLQGMRWYLGLSGYFDEATDPRYNARRLEVFYEEHGLWKPFTYPHQHFGPMQCRFKEPLEVPAALVNSNGLIDAFEMQLIHHNPSF